jgi:SAM-dependent methyltransferase
VPGSFQHQVLVALETARNYTSWIASLVLPYLGDDPIEIGSGTGTSASIWLETGVPRLTVSDASEEMVADLHRRFAGDSRVSVRRVDLLESEPRGHSACVALNVLEHIADDRAAIRAMSCLVRREGRIVVLVPAFPFAFSRFDRAIGHERRYTRASLRRAFEDAELDVERLHYVNAPGLLAWTIGMKLLRVTPRDGFALRVWDRLVVPPTRWLEAHRSPPFGQSLLAVARRRT